MECWLLCEEEGEEVLQGKGDGEDTPEFEDAGYFIGVSRGHESEGGEDGDVEGEDLAEGGRAYFAKLNKDCKKVIIIITYQKADHRNCERRSTFIHFLSLWDDLGLLYGLAYSLLQRPS